MQLFGYEQAANANCQYSLNCIWGNKKMKNTVRILTDEDEERHHE